jgi:hypothetical protein
VADLGEDFAGVSDIDANWSLVSGRLALAQAVACRVLEEPGGLFYDEDYGGGLRRLLGASGVSVTGNGLEEEIKKDERVESADVALSFNEGTRELSVSITIDEGDGPFAFVVDANQLTIELLDGNV